MSEYFETVKNYIAELGFVITKEDTAEELVVIEDQERGISGLIVDCEDPILVIEQIMFKLQGLQADQHGQMLYRLLQINRNLVHGAFAIDEEGEYLLFRDTLALENLDFNELEASINALSIALAEFGEELLSFSNQVNPS